MAERELPGLWHEMSTLTAEQEVRLATLNAEDQAQVRAIVAQRRRIAEDGHAMTGEVLETVSRITADFEATMSGADGPGMTDLFAKTRTSMAMAVEFVRAAHEGLTEDEMWSVERIAGATPPDEPPSDQPPCPGP